MIYSPPIRHGPCLHRYTRDEANASAGRAYSMGKHRDDADRHGCLAGEGVLSRKRCLDETLEWRSG